MTILVLLTLAFIAAIAVMFYVAAVLAGRLAIWLVTRSGRNRARRNHPTH